MVRGCHWRLVRQCDRRPNLHSAPGAGGVHTVATGDFVDHVVNVRPKHWRTSRQWHPSASDMFVQGPGWLGLQVSTLR